MKKIREFIYLDIEKVKSILSQIEEGLLIEESKSSEKSLEIDGNVGTNVLLDLILKGEVGAEVLFSNKKDETKVLHDYIYNLLESELIKNNTVVKVHDNNKRDSKLPSEINENSYVLLKGKIKIEDYNFMRNTIENFNDLTVAFQIATSGKTKGHYDEKWDDFKEVLLNKNELFNDAYVESLSKIIKQFYNNRLMIKCMPFEKNVLLNFVGLLKNEHLKEDIEDILFKYGSSPSMDWYIFGKISAISSKDSTYLNGLKDSKYKRIKEHWDRISIIVNQAEEYNKLPSSLKKSWNSFNLNEEDFLILRGKNLEITFEGLFESFDSVSYEANIKYPSVKFTPIAIYRE